MRRRRDLIAMFVAELGGEASVSPMTMLAIIAAADASVLAERYRAKALAGEAVTLADLERLDRTAREAIAALGIGGTADAGTLKA